MKYNEPEFLERERASTVLHNVRRARRLRMRALPIFSPKFWLLSCICGEVNPMPMRIAGHKQILMRWSMLGAAAGLVAAKRSVIFALLL